MASSSATQAHQVTARTHQAQHPAGLTGGGASSSVEDERKHQRLLKVWTENLKFPVAAQPEIIRAHQKDDYLVDLLQNRIEPLIRAIKGSRWTNHHFSQLQDLSRLIYLSLTTLPGSQTLGEEYCDLLQLNTFTNNFPTIWQRSFLIIVQVFSPRILSRFSKAVYEYVTRWNNRSSSAESPHQSDDRHPNNNNHHDSSGGLSDRSQLLQLLKTKFFSSLGFLFSSLDWATTLDTFDALHLSIFYLTGRYFRWSNRLTGIAYISNRVRPLRPDGLGRVSPPSYELLGVMMMVQLVVKIGSKYRQNQRRLEQLRPASSPVPSQRGSSNPKNAPAGERVVPRVDGRLIDELIIPPDDAQDSGHHTDQEDEDGVEDCPEGVLLASEQSSLSPRCTLCLGPRKHQASLECGHLFCWKCVVSWVKEKPECPLCRHTVRAADLLPLYNF